MQENFSKSTNSLNPFLAFYNYQSPRETFEFINFLEKLQGKQTQWTSFIF